LRTPVPIGHRSIADLDHSTASARIDLSNGRMNGFVAAQYLRSVNGRQAMGYYDGADLPFYWNMADRYVLFDHFFSSALGGSYPNHLYWIAAGLGQPINYKPRRGVHTVDSVPPHGLKITTIFDRLAGRAVVEVLRAELRPDDHVSHAQILTNANRASQAVWAPLTSQVPGQSDPPLPHR
jgi:phospholipase C